MSLVEYFHAIGCFCEFDLLDAKGETITKQNEFLVEIQEQWHLAIQSKRVVLMQ